MITKNILNFLNDLKENNDRVWFHENKARYESALSEFETVANQLISAISKHDKTIVGLTAKDCMFRIYKDIRFSKDKTPYKTNFGVHVVRGGRKSNFAGFYWHIEPGEYFFAGGKYLPSPEVLKAIRTEIYENVDEYKRLIFNNNFRKWYGDVWGEKLTTAPKGFDKNFADIDLLKLKSYVSWHNYPEDTLFSQSFVDYAVEAYLATKEYNEFLNRSIENI